MLCGLLSGAAADQGQWKHRVLGPLAGSEVKLEGIVCPLPSLLSATTPALPSLPHPGKGDGRQPHALGASSQLEGRVRQGSVL